MVQARHRPRRKNPPHPCVSETFGGRAITVSLVTGDVFAADAAPLTAEERREAAHWVWLVLREAGFPTTYEQAELACGN